MRPVTGRRPPLAIPGTPPDIARGAGGPSIILAMDALRRTVAEWIERRWLQAALAVLLVLILKPSPRPTGFVVGVRQGVTALGAGRPVEALREVEAALEAEPSWTPLRRLAADAALAAGDWQAAADHIERLPASDRADPALHCPTWLARLGDGANVPVALPELRRYLTCPDSGTALARLVEAEIGDGRLEAAERLVVAWTEAAPADAAALALLGRLKAARSPADAGAALERSLSLDPEAGQPLLGLLAATRAAGTPASLAAGVGQAFLQAGDWTLAAASLEHALELDPGQARARAFLGLAQAQLGGDGLADAEAALALTPNDPAILAIHASLLRGRGDLTAARDELLAAAELAPADPGIAAELGATYAALGDLPSALAAYQHAALAAPDNPDFWLLLAQFSVDQQTDLEGTGLPAARNAIALDGADSSAWLALGRLHTALGNHLLAERALRRSLALEPRDPSAWYALAMVQLATDDRLGASQALHLTLTLDPGGTWADLAQRALDRLGLP